MKEYVMAFIFACVTVFVLTGPLTSMFRRKTIMMSKGVPMSGGIPIALALLAGLAVFRLPQWFGLFSGLVLIAVMGIFDDAKELSVREKFLFQFAAAAAVMAGGFRTYIAFIPAWMNLALTFLWIVCITNSFNLLDIADGLAGGIALTVCAGFLAIAQVNGDVPSSVMVCILAGAVIGFLPYNLPRARAYMGNTGSHLIGLFIAAVSLNIGYASSMSRALSLASPLVILGFPLADTVFVVLLRIAQGKSAVAKSKDHLALRMLTAGYSKNRMLGFMVLVSLFFALSGVGVCFLPPLFGSFFICAAVVITIWLSLRMSKVAVHA